MIWIQVWTTLWCLILGLDSPSLLSLITQNKYIFVVKIIQVWNERMTKLKHLFWAKYNKGWEIFLENSLTYQCSFQCTLHCTLKKNWYLCFLYAYRFYSTFLGYLLAGEVSDMHKGVVEGCENVADSKNILAFGNLRSQTDDLLFLLFLTLARCHSWNTSIFNSQINLIWKPSSVS